MQGTAIYIAECSHSFHFHCIAAHVRKYQTLACPVCSATWCQAPILTVIPASDDGNCVPSVPQQDRSVVVVKPGRVASAEMATTPTMPTTPTKTSGNKGYSDDEPLLSLGGNSTSRFNPIPEAEVEDDEEEKLSDNEFQGFCVSMNNRSPSPPDRQEFQQRYRSTSRNSSLSVEITANSDVALLTTGRNHDKYVVAVKVKAPSITTGNRRAPIDLVIVVDVGGAMTGSKLQILKRSIRQLIILLTPSDRLSLVAFASTTKRLLPLKKMTPQGQRCARRIVDRLVSTNSAGSIVGDALRKATRVLEDRRERNPVGSIMLLADGQNNQQHSPVKAPNHHHASSISCRSSSTTDSAGTRFAHIEIPVPSQNVEKDSTTEPPENAFARCVSGLLSVVVQEVTLKLNISAGELSSVCSIGSQPMASTNDTGIVHLGDLYAEEERDLLIEIRVPSTLVQFDLNVNCNLKDAVTQDEVVGVDQSLPVTLPGGMRSGNNRQQRKQMSAKAEKIRNIFVTTRAITEARRLTVSNDMETALHLLLSARALLLQTTVVSTDENLKAVDAELVELRRRRQRISRREEGRNAFLPEAVAPVTDGGIGEALTPTSAWRAAERLAKLAVMKKSLNRVSDLHGFEDARF